MVAGSALTDDEAHNPLAVIATGLAAEARGESVDGDKMMEAATLAAGAHLVGAGVPVDAVERLFRDRDHTFRFAYDASEDELSVDVEWD